MLRLKYRYLDCAASVLQKNLILRHKVIKFMRDYLDAQGFIEIETPMMISHTRGRRDYVVPCRCSRASLRVAAKPAAAQAIADVAGFERYFQIARCFRDEDLRGDRQPEFTQLDWKCPSSNVMIVLAMVEGLITALVPAVTPHKRIIAPFPKLLPGRDGALRHR